MKNLNALQIKTAEEVLNKALQNKKNQIAEEAFKKDLAKFSPQTKAFYHKALSLRQDAVALKKIVEKNPRLTIDLDDYSSLTNKLPKTLEDIDEYSDSIIKARGTSYSDRIGSYAPNMKKEEKAVEDFILGLKLGTSLLADMQKLLDLIAKVK